MLSQTHASSSPVAFFVIFHLPEEALLSVSDAAGYKCHIHEGCLFRTTRRWNTTPSTVVPPEDEADPSNVGVGPSAPIKRSCSHSQFNLM